MTSWRLPPTTVSPSASRCRTKWFGGVVVTNGAGSPRKGPYANYTDEEMQEVRMIKQRKAAFVGE